MESLNSINLPFIELDLAYISGYSFILTVFVLITMLLLFMKNKIKHYLLKREKLIKMSENYERKRECRNGLRV
jgi:hypothetical protein